ncbi:unnamed protein product [Echinostoma caproni]|uniref:Uncharacterized protein n=1 Tax=Echinostoma caproni TaxID=27848 RepID=A0A183A188_9TREM|nr:unnamed protein product [Echinostoma caproni]
MRRQCNVDDWKVASSRSYLLRLDQSISLSDRDTGGTFVLHVEDTRGLSGGVNTTWIDPGSNVRLNYSTCDKFQSILEKSTSQLNKVLCETRELFESTIPVEFRHYFAQTSPVVGLAAEPVFHSVQDPVTMKLDAECTDMEPNLSVQPERYAADGLFE